MLLTQFHEGDSQIGALHSQIHEGQTRIRDLEERVPTLVVHYREDQLRNHALEEMMVRNEDLVNFFMPHCKTKF